MVRGGFGWRRGDRRGSGSVGSGWGVVWWRGRVEGAGM
jgi:hypothetical protein